MANDIDVEITIRKNVGPDSVVTLVWTGNKWIIASDANDWSKAGEMAKKLFGIEKTVKRIVEKMLSDKEVI